MSNLSPVPDVVRLNEPADLASAVPHLLGFHPTQSLVGIALSGPRERIVFTMRIDLLDSDEDAAVARMTAARLTQAGARSALVFLYTDFVDVDTDLPRRPLVEAIAAALRVPLRDALLVDQGRLWSYICRDSRCCPAEGRPVPSESPGALALAAAHALHGNVVLADRDALVATTRAVGGVTAASMRQAIDRALPAVTRASRGPTFVADSCALVDDICGRLANPPRTVTHEGAAQVLLRAHHLEVRDVLLARLAAGDDLLERLVAEVARLAQPPFDAPAATMLAMSAYLRGDGVVAMAAAERALDTDPDYSLAQLVVECLERQLEPGRIRAVWREHLP